jgi:hypothetical protein
MRGQLEFGVTGASGGGAVSRPVTTERRIGFWLLLFGLPSWPSASSEERRRHSRRQEVAPGNRLRSRADGQSFS